MFNGTYTVKVKRHRKRYKQIQSNARQMGAYRREQAEMERMRGAKYATAMSLIRLELDLPIPEDEQQYIDNAVLDQYPVMITRDMVKQALKYLRADFTPEALYAAVKMDYYGDRLYEWITVRWAIIEHVEGRARWDIIPSAYYGFQDEHFFFDEHVVNDVGHNHTQWKYKGPHVMRPELKKKFDPATDVPARESCNESPTYNPSLWQRFKEWAKCDNYQ